MSLSTSETITLSAEAVSLGTLIAAIVAADSEGGKQVTKAEAIELLKKATALAAQVAIDILD